ncbi:MAG: hypothetical protein QOI80_26 [Solirubrobacteraceae bacterium]|jgi:hypothetical protein|nr:hypothetical protein [Solirubrobacteraceae bacterium]
MSPVWIASLVLAWVVIALLVVVVLSLMRQLGAVQAMLGARAQLHDAIPELADAAPVVYVFHAPGCPGCEWIPDALAAEPGLVGVAGDEALALPPAIRPESVPAHVGLAAGGIVAALGRPRSVDDLREALALCRAVSA